MVNLTESTIYQPWILVRVARVRFQSSSHNKMPKCSYYISSHVAYHHARDMQETTSSPHSKHIYSSALDSNMPTMQCLHHYKTITTTEFDSKIGVTFTARVSDWMLHAFVHPFTIARFLKSGGEHWHAPLRACVSTVAFPRNAGKIF